MSKSNLKAEDIFFGLQKAIGTDEVEAVVSDGASTVGEGVVNAEPVPAAAPAAQAPHGSPAVTGTGRRHGPVPNPENQRRVSVNVLVSPETKYTMTSLINEMKLHGLVGRYSMTDFVEEAINDKIEKERARIMSPLKLS